MTRASEAAARAFWPLGNTRLEKRLGLIAAPTLILWGERDAVLPPSYAKKFAAGINGSTRVANRGRCRPSRLSRPARRGGPGRPGTFCLITLVFGPGLEVASAVRIAAIFPGHVRKLALIAPFGLFDEADARRRSLGPAQGPVSRA